MKNMKDLMLDIETLSVSTNAVITQIGVCFFDRKTGETGKSFLANIDIKSCLQEGMIIDADTLMWWLKQPTNISWLDNTRPVHLVLQGLVPFLQQAKDIWSHSTFDIPILANAFKKVSGQGPLPFSFRITRDIRTLTDLAGFSVEEMKKKTIKKTHNALEDCLFQIKYCVECFNKIGSAVEQAQEIEQLKNKNKELEDRF